MFQRGIHLHQVLGLAPPPLWSIDNQLVESLPQPHGADLLKS